MDNRRFRDKVWRGVYKQMPLYLQRNGICYAYAAIQMVDDWRQVHGMRITKNIALSSPIHAAFLTKQLKDVDADGTLDGEWMVNALEAIKKNGMCRDDVIQKALNEFAKKNKLDQREFLELAAHMFLNFAGDPEKMEHMSYQQIWNKYIKNKKMTISGRSINKNGDLGRMYSHLAYYKGQMNKGEFGQSALFWFMDYIFRECKKPENIYLQTKKLPPFRSQRVFRTSRKRTYHKNRIKRLLNRKKATVIGVNYCTQIFKNISHIGMDKKSGAFNSPSNWKNCEIHASVLVGKKEINGKCHYLLRNSWGDTCSYYKWSCKYNAGHEVIGIWIEEEAFLNNLYNFVYFE